MVQPATQMPQRKPTKKLTPRQQFARDQRQLGLNDREAGELAGVGRAAMAMRRLRARRQREGYERALSSNGKRVKLRPISLSFLPNV